MLKPVPVLCVATVALLVACGESGEPLPTPTTANPPAAAGAAQVNAPRLLAADQEPGQWMTHGRTYDEQRYSPLTEIHTGNVSELGLAWFGDYSTGRTQQATPIFVDGVLYVTTAWSNVKAFDARTGRQIWRYDAQVPGEWGVRACCDVINRGVAVWNGKVYVGTIDGRLVALDAATGQPVWEADTLIDRELSYTITGAPRVVKGRVLIGNGGAEYGVRGYVSAYDAESGELDWRLFTVPGNPALGFENDVMEMAAATWNGEWWELGGGGTVWDSMSYDPDLDLLYIGVGNGSPWNRSLRSPGGGDNLFLSSIVALNPDDGSYVWHYQTTPGESWDYTASQHMILADLDFDGTSRRVLMQAPKNGFFYVLDAASGELISAEAFAAVNWATGIDMETGRPIENPDARYDETGRAYAVQPSAQGAHSWHPMAYNPDTGLVYFSAGDTAMVYAHDRNFDPHPLTSNLGVDLGAGMAELGPGAMAGLPSGFYILGWDPVAQQEVWRANGPFAGMLTTAGGLVFHGTNNTLVARDADDGTQLWQSPNLQTGVVAAPITFELDGVQHVAVVAGRATNNYYAPHHSRLLVFRIGASATLPAPAPFTMPTLNPPPSTADDAVIARGQTAYQANCMICHDAPAGGTGALVMFRRGMFPDLAFSAALQSEAYFHAVVMEGALAGNGMASFADSIDAETAAAIREYLIRAANNAAGR